MSIGWLLTILSAVLGASIPIFPHFWGMIWPWLVVFFFGFTVGAGWNEWCALKREEQTHPVTIIDGPWQGEIRRIK